MAKRSLIQRGYFSSQTLHWLPAHHSNPTKRLKIRISNHVPRLFLLLARDSGDPTEYWVFWPREYWVFNPKYRLTADHDIGRIKTHLFDTY